MDTKQSSSTEKQAGGAREKARQSLQNSWYSDQNREIVIYYLIAVCFLELIVGAIAFFYGVVHAVPQYPGGPRMASFPWVGWLIAAILSPVGLLLLLHLSGQFFSRSLNSGQAAAGQGEGGAAGDSGEGVVPERVQHVYNILKHAPTIVILLGLIGLGCALFFLDSAMDMLVQLGGALTPYIPWIVGGAVAFLVICYLGRLWFLSRHRRMEQEFAYRMHVFEKTGVIIASEGCIPMRVQDGKLQLLDAGQSVATALPSAEPAEPAEPAEGGEAAANAVKTVADTDVVDLEPEGAGGKGAN